VKYTAPLLALALLTAAFCPAPRAVHCQVPCGVYGDSARITMMLEDATTIEKGMNTIRDLEGADAKNYNQIVRWVTTKDEHATHIQETVAAYWLTQRIKAPAAGADEAARAKYLGQLELMHGLTVAAMKCKQTTDTTHVQSLRKLTEAFAGTYFSEEDLAHMRGHHK